ncbi:MAG: ABC transporter ATP-binding protein [bacterium]|nr:ABC transporter ATP-binding protein [Candidatus Kapabacteria bacterium]
MNTTPIISITDRRAFALDSVSKRFVHAGGLTHAVRDVSLAGDRGEFIALVGPSGSGKTTLLSLLAGLLEPTSGRLQLFGNDVSMLSSKQLQRLRAARIGFVFQNFQLFDPLSVEENIVMVQRFNRVSKYDARRKAATLLDMLEIGHLARKWPDQISQGERQRVAIARAIANNPALLLADEPTASLESRQGFEIVQLLRRCADEMGCCVVCATHDLRMSEHAVRTVRIEDGCVVSQQPALSRTLVNR